MNQKRIKEKIEKIEKIYGQFRKELASLREEQDELISETLKKIDEEKIQKILKSIKS